MISLLEKISQKIKKDPSCYQAFEDMYYICLEEIKADEAHYYKAHNVNPSPADMKPEAINWLKWESEMLMRTIPKMRDDLNTMADMFELHKKVLLKAAPYDLDSYMLYIEWDREPDKKFYVPRRKQLLPVVEALQKLAEGDYDLVAISMPPGSGKSTTAIFFLCWLAGREPDKPILGGSHSNGFLRGVYDECLRVIQGNGGEYLWADVFPGVPLSGTNAKDMRIDLGKPKRFETLEFSSIGSGNAGKVRAESLLYCDDLVDGIETAMSPERLEKLWQQYTTDLRQRKIGSCRELHIATRWSLHDVIGRLEEAYGESGRATFIIMPALNENDESNFDYPCDAGFTTEFYHQQREIMDEASWRALYMNQPIEREGRLYAVDELRRYFELPDGDPDSILAVCDTKDRGSDFCVMPIIYKYGNDWYVEDVVCDNGKPEIVEARLVEMLRKHKVHMARFESNSAGGKIAEKVQSEIKRLGGITKITTKFTTANKETKIVTRSGVVKERCLFKDDSVLVGGAHREYRKMLEQLCGYSMVGKNKHDDVPDAFAQLVDYMESFGVPQVTVFKRPW